MKEVAIVVLSWNAQPLLERYLPDLVRHTPLGLADIILADNGSSDASVAYAKSLGVKVIELGENYGFARGYNEAIARIEHNYVLLLNNDVRVSPGWLEPLYHFMETHTEVAGFPKAAYVPARRDSSPHLQCRSAVRHRFPVAQSPVAETECEYC